MSFISTILDVDQTRYPPPEELDRRQTSPHRTAVHPEHLSKAFAEARDGSGLYGDMEPAKGPTFHEIRGLGADLPGPRESFLYKPLI
jgi:hypothetical protein